MAIVFISKVEQETYAQLKSFKFIISLKSFLFRVVSYDEKALINKEVALGALIDIEGAFGNTSLT